MNYKSTLKDILQSAPNYNRCSDCHNLNPTWCSTTFNVFLCTRCATLHKQVLNKGSYVSYIKSISLDRWDYRELSDFEKNSCQWDIDRSLFTTSDDNYNIEQLLKNKYILPVQEQSYSRSSRSYDNNSRSGRNREWPILTGRRARNQELQKFASHIREIQNRSTNYYTTDHICEALSITRGNEFDALQILKYNFERNEQGPPSLPERPDQSVKEAVFDGFNTINTTSDISTTNKINAPKPAIFDGMTDMISNNDIIVMNNNMMNANNNIPLGQQQTNPFQIQPQLQNFAPGIGLQFNDQQQVMSQMPQQLTQTQLHPQSAQTAPQYNNGMLTYPQQTQMTNSLNQFGVTNVQHPIQPAIQPVAQPMEQSSIQPGLQTGMQLGLQPNISQMYSQQQHHQQQQQSPGQQMPNQQISGQQFIPQQNTQFLGQNQIPGQPQFATQ